MDSSKTQLKELRKVLQDMNSGEGCTICRFVKIFAFVVLFLVVIFVFFLRTKQEERLQPLPPEKAPQISPAAWNQHVLELGKAIHPEATSTQRTPQGIDTTPSLQTAVQPDPLPLKNK